MLELLYTEVISGNLKHTDYIYFIGQLFLVTDDRFI